MKQQLQQSMRRIDAMSLRERAILFVTTTLGVIYLVNSLVLDPQFAKQKRLAEQIKQSQMTMTAIETGIQQALKSRTVDPDAANRMRLLDLKQQYAQVQNILLDMQKGLVAPERMASLLEDILKRNGTLQLVALKTLPVIDINPTTGGDSAPATQVPAQKSPAVAAVQDRLADQAAASIYKHGVEITLQGNYLDMIGYMSELEAMPWQLFWGKATLHVDDYPKSTLTLTLYTMSLDKKWLNL